MTYGWNTQKTETGFRFTVYSAGYQTPTITLHEGVCSSRAKTSLLARRICGGYRRERDYRASLVAAQLDTLSA